MLTKINSCSLFGINAVKCTVEIDTSKGIPTINLLGQLNNVAKEIRSKAITAIKNSGFKYTPKKININILPANIPKIGTSLDLPICVGIMCNLGFINSFINKEIFIIGEVSLTGKILSLNGILPMLLVAKENGCKIAFIPYDNLPESSLIQDMTVIGVSTLEELVEKLNSKNFVKSISNITYKKDDLDYPLFENISSCDSSIRLALISASGFHNIIYCGPNGIGKTLICSATRGIMPDPNFQELLEINSIYSAYNTLQSKKLLCTRPFRSPPINISKCSMFGSDSRLTPGEITLSHNGILFLDEINLFKGEILSALRVPLDKGYVVYNRNSISIKFPCKFLLLGAMNSCPCGNYPDMSKCICSYRDILNYRKKFSTPLLDRIDIFTNLSKSNKKSTSSYSTNTMKELVDKVKKIQFERNGNKFNANLSLTEIEKVSYLSSKNHCYLMDMLSKLNISFRGFARVLKLARTIADLDLSETVKRQHIDEALLIERSR